MIWRFTLPPPDFTVKICLGEKNEGCGYNNCVFDAKFVVCFMGHAIRWSVGRKAM